MAEEESIPVRVWVRCITEDGRGLEYELNHSAETAVKFMGRGTYALEPKALARLVPVGQLPPVSEAATTWTGRADRVAWILDNCTEGELAMLYRLLRQRRWTDWGAQQIELHERRGLEVHTEVKVRRI